MKLELQAKMGTADVCLDCLVASTALRPRCLRAPLHASRSAIRLQVTRCDVRGFGCRLYQHLLGGAETSHRAFQRLAAC